MQLHRVFFLSAVAMVACGDESEHLAHNHTGSVAISMVPADQWPVGFEARGSPMTCLRPVGLLRINVAGGPATLKVLNFQTSDGVFRRDLRLATSDGEWIRQEDTEGVGGWALANEQAISVSHWLAPGEHELWVIGCIYPFAPEGTSYEFRFVGGIAQDIDGNGVQLTVGSPASSTYEVVRGLCLQVGTLRASPNVFKAAIVPSAGFVSFTFAANGPQAFIAEGIGFSFSSSVSRDIEYVKSRIAGARIVDGTHKFLTDECELLDGEDIVTQRPRVRTVCPFKRMVVFHPGEPRDIGVVIPVKPGAENGEIIVGLSGSVIVGAIDGCDHGYSFGGSDDKTVTLDVILPPL